MALGKEGSAFMTALAAFGLILVRLVQTYTSPSTQSSWQNTSVAIVAASRLVFAVARDGVLPGSKWIGQVDSEGQPRNAVTVMYIFGAVILCSILPSQVAFYS